MKLMIILFAMVVVGGLYFLQGPGSSAQNKESAKQLDLKRKIELIFLHEPHPDTGQVYDPAVEIEKLDQKVRTHAILSEMVKRHRHAQEGTPEYLYFEGVVRVAGTLGLVETSETLNQILIDPSAPGNVRSLAAKSLGQIDVEENKEALLNALRSSAEDDDLLRAAAAEALAATRDPRVLNELETRAFMEQDSVIKERIQASARKLRARIAGQKN